MDELYCEDPEMEKAWENVEKLVTLALGLTADEATEQEGRDLRERMEGLQARRAHGYDPRSEVDLEEVKQAALGRDASLERFVWTEPGWVHEEFMVIDEDPEVRNTRWMKQIEQRLEQWPRKRGSMYDWKYRIRELVDLAARTGESPSDRTSRMGLALRSFAGELGKRKYPTTLYEAGPSPLEGLSTGQTMDLLADYPAGILTYDGDQIPVSREDTEIIALSSKDMTVEEARERVDRYGQGEGLETRLRWFLLTPELQAFVRYVTGDETGAWASAAPNICRVAMAAVYAIALLESHRMREC